METAATSPTVMGEVLPPAHFWRRLSSAAPPPTVHHAGFASPSKWSAVWRCVPSTLGGMTNREVERALRKMAQNQRLFETAFRRSAVIQDTARLLQTTQWPGLARQFGFGKTFRGSPAALALQGLSAHQNLVGVRLADAFAKSASFRIAENTQRTLTSLLTTRSSLIEDSLRPLRTYRGVFDALGESVRRFAEQQREMDEHTDAFVVRHGWPVPLNLPLPAYVQIVRMAASQKREVTQSMVHWFRPQSKAFKTCAETLLSRPLLESRRPLLRQVLRAHRLGDHYLVISTLMPLVEGVLVDGVFGIAGAAPKKGRATKAVQKLETEDPDDTLVRALGNLVVAGAAGMGLFTQSDPAHYGVKGEPRSLNRHAILHGFARRYGSEANALRMVLLLTVIVEVLDIEAAITSST